MTNCPNCGAPPASGVSWGCGSRWKSGGIDRSSFCRVRSMCHKLSESMTAMDIYDAAIGKNWLDEQALISRLRKWYEGGGRDPWELHEIVWEYFKQEKRDGWEG